MHTVVSNEYRVCEKYRDHASLIPHMHTDTILDGPHNITVFQGQETMFVCTIPDEPISMEWFINGVDYFDVVNGAHRTSRRNSHNQSNADHILFLPARARLNNSLVQCRYIGEIAILTCGNNATLTIQGI